MKKFTLSATLAVALGACSALTNAQTTRPAEGLAGLAAAGSATDTTLAQATSQSLSEDLSPSNSAKVYRARQLSIMQESDLVFKILAAEMAGRRGRVDIAARNYYDAATVSGDARVAERATKLALYSRDIDRAEGAVDLWVNLSPESVDAWQHKAQVLMQRKNVQGTTSALEQVINLSEGAPSAVIPGVVNSILRQSDADLGVQVLTELGQRFPDSADTQYGIGRFAMSKGERETARAAFERALQIDPSNVDAMLANARLKLAGGDGDEALQLVQTFVGKEADNVPAQLGYARLLVEAGKYELATERFEVIAENFPTDADAIYSIGLLALEITRVEQAEDYLQQVVALQQHEATANYYLARISDSRRDYREAISRYRKVEEGENFFDAQIRAAELHGLVGEVDIGRRLIESLKAYSDEKSIQIELITSESRLLNSNDQHEESLQVLTNGLDQYKDDTTLLYARALVAEQLDKREVFEDDLARVIALQPDNGYALNAFGYFLTDRNERLDEAEGYLVRAFELMPEDPAIIDSLGWLYYRQSKYPESIELLRKAHEILPDAEIAAHLGEVLWVSGDQDGATKVWEEALKASPDDDLLNNVVKKYIR